MSAKLDTEVLLLPAADGRAASTGFDTVVDDRVAAGGAGARAISSACSSGGVTEAAGVEYPGARALGAAGFGVGVGVGVGIGGRGTSRAAL
jgi:hypothetical protein